MAEPVKLSIGGAIRAARSSFDENSNLILRITILFALMHAASALLDFTGPAGTALSLGVTLLLSATYSGMITVIICLPGKPEVIAEPWATIRPLLARLVWVTLLYFALVIAGLFVLIIPGLIVFTILSVAGQAVVVEGAGVFDSFGRSFALVKDNAWRVFGYLLIIGLLGLLMLALVLLVALPLGTGVAASVVAAFLGNLLSTPVVAIGAAALYSQLKSLELENNPEPAEHEISTENDPS